MRRFCFLDNSSIQLVIIVGCGCIDEKLVLILYICIVFLYLLLCYFHLFSILGELASIVFHTSARKCFVITTKI